MLHGTLIAPDESQFAGAPSKFAGLTTGTAPATGDIVVIPDAFLLFNCEFKRVGDDLKLVGADGRTHTVADYFKGDKHPTLATAQGAQIPASVIDALAGSQAPGQYAQAGAQPGTAEAIGKVATAAGNATIVRNGVAINVNSGDVVLKNDVLRTGGDGALGVTFNDGTTFSLSANAQMAVNDFVYQDGGSNNQAVFNLVRGSISFFASQVAKTGDMKVTTPTATMGIRGTTVVVDIVVDTANPTSIGQVKIKLYADANGNVGRVEVSTIGGAPLGTLTATATGFIITPAGAQPNVQQEQVSQQEAARDMALLQALFNSTNIGNQLLQQQGGPQDPNNPNPNTNGSNGSSTDPNVIITVNQTQNGDGTTTTTINGVTINPPGNASPGSEGGGFPADTSTPIPVVLTETTPTINTIVRGDGDDTIVGTPGVDIIFAGGGDDTITPLGSDDQVYGQAGDDLIIAGSGDGNDLYDGGSGSDTVSYASLTQDLIIDLVGGTVTGAGIGTDTLVSIENATGGSGNDVFMVNGTHWTIDGRAGIDRIIFVGGLDVYGLPTGPEAHNVEIVDLNVTDDNTAVFDARGIAEMNEDGVLRVLGSEGDVVSLTTGDPGWHPNGYWRPAGECVEFEGDNETPDARFNVFEFVDVVEDCEVVLATVYVQEGVEPHFNNGPDVFLAGNYIELGVSSAGSLGSATDAPQGMHPYGANGISMVFDADGFGQGNGPASGDVSLPLTPEDAIVIAHDGQNFANAERRGVRDFVAQSFETSDDGVLRVITAGVTMTGLVFTQVIEFRPNDTYFKTTVTLINESGEAIEDARFMRNFDPDQDAVLVGDGAPTTTFNDVLSGSGEHSVTAARAVGVASNVAVSLVSFDSNAQASVFGFSNRDAYAPGAYDDPVDPNGAANDQAITLTFDFGTIAAGGSASGVYYTAFQQGGTGTAGNDLVMGGDDCDVLNGQGGDDLFVGFGGGDTFVLVLTSGDSTIADFSACEGDLIDISAFLALNGFDELCITISGNDSIVHLSGTQSLTVRNSVAEGETTLTGEDFVFAEENQAPTANVGEFPPPEPPLEDQGFSVLLTGSDVDGSVTRFVIDGQPQNGKFYTGSDFSSQMSNSDLQNLLADYNANLGRYERTVWFRPDANYNGLINFDYIAVDDNGEESESAAVSFSISPVNDAPSISSATLPSIYANTAEPEGATIATLFAGKFQDVDQNATLAGIAVVENYADPETEGTWQFWCDGGYGWVDIGLVESQNALALRADTLIRFVPVPGFESTPTPIYVHALDNTYAGGFSYAYGNGEPHRVTIDASSNGGSTPISSSSVTIGTYVDPPLVTADVVTAAGFDMGSIVDGILEGVLVDNQANPQTSNVILLDYVDAHHGLLRYEITTANLDIDVETPTVDTDSDFQLLGGTITGLRILNSNDDIVYQATGYNLDALDIEDAIDHYDDTGGEDGGDTSQFVNLLHSQPYIITDGEGVDTLIGGDFRDIIVSEYGADTIVAGSGDDIIVVHSNAPWSVNGGDGIDMLRFEGTFDIPGTQGLPVVNGIEIIDLGDESDTHVNIDAGSLYAMSQTSQLGPLRIMGGDGYDSITLFPNDGELQGTWTKEDGLTSFGDAYTGNTTFDRYTFTLGDDDLSIYVQHGVGVTMMPPSGPLLG